MLRACDGGETRARRQTRDVMNDVDALNVGVTAREIFR